MKMQKTALMLIGLYLFQPWPQMLSDISPIYF